MQTIWYDTVATLAWIAGRTERLRLLSHVFVPAYRHPLVSAKAFLTLDELSGGRTILGVGTGHVEGEFAALGADYANRGAVTDECIDVLRAAFTDEYPSYEGEHFTRRGRRPPAPAPPGRAAHLGRRLLQAGPAPGRRPG